MKVAVIGILIATYLTFSYKCRSLILYWKNQVVEISIISVLAISILFSYSNEAFVWLLVFMMILHQVIQLSIEVTSRLKKQKIERAQYEERVSLSA